MPAVGEDDYVSAYGISSARESKRPTKLFTQGFFFLVENKSSNHSNVLVESTGLYGRSELRASRADFSGGVTGEKEVLLAQSDLSSEFFGEGAAEDPGNLPHETSKIIHQLVWKRRVIFTYELQVEFASINGSNVASGATLRRIRNATYPRDIFQGWGFASFPSPSSSGQWGIPDSSPLVDIFKTQMVWSDGSARLFFVEPPSNNNEEWRIVRHIDVFDCDALPGQLVDGLNELEIVPTSFFASAIKDSRVRESLTADAYAWANIYGTNCIVVIDLMTGHVRARLTFPGLSPDADRNRVSNGIAFDRDTGMLWMTGKNWGSVYEVTTLTSLNGARKATQRCSASFATPRSDYRPLSELRASCARSTLSPSLSPSINIAPSSPLVTTAPTAAAIVWSSSSTYAMIALIMLVLFVVVLYVKKRGSMVDNANENFAKHEVSVASADPKERSGLLGSKSMSEDGVSGESIELAAVRT